MERKNQNMGKGVASYEDNNEHLYNYVEGNEEDCSSFDGDEGTYDNVESNKRGTIGGEEGNEEVDDTISNKQLEDFREDGMNELCPRVGMEFGSQEEAYSFYNLYAGNMGFSVRKYSSNKSHRTHDIIGRTFCCSLEGFRDPRSKRFEERTRNRANTRTGCKAMLSIRKRKEDKWVVTRVVEEHNHKFVTPSNKHKLRSIRKIVEGQRRVLENMLLAGSKTNLMMSSMALEVGGSHNIGFTERNFLSTKRQRELRKEDAEAILDYFERQQMENPSFFYSIQVDSECQMTNFFWADARSRMDYHHFGDVVCFDPTYGTNRYGMPFVPIVGINHHCQIVLFGGALLYTETEESFVWLMKTWMMSMNGKQPKVILTDEESAIGRAIECVLPGTRHRYCLWHITKNAMKNIPQAVNAHKGFIHDFNNCVYGNEAVEEFESNWKAMLKRYNLGDNSWLNKLFDKREKWASVYTRDIFCATMYTTQCGESINAYFNGYLKRSMPLSEFVKQYERVVVKRREQENNEDFETNYKVPVLRFSMEIEKEAAKVYTRAIFQKFQDELYESLSYRHKKVEEIGTKSMYHVWKMEHEQALRTVTFNSSDTSYKCSCQLFEFAGYLCRHILKIFVVLDVQNLPPQYILKRWTRDAKFGPVVDDQGEDMRVDCHETVTVRYNKLFQEAVNVAAKGATSIEVYNVAMRGLHNTLKEVETALKNVTNSPMKPNKEVGSGHGDKISQVSLGNPPDNQRPLPDPPIAKHKKRSMEPWIDKLSKNKKGTIQNTHENSLDLVSQQNSGTVTNEMFHETRRRRGKVGKGLQTSIAVTNDQPKSVIQPPDPLGGHQSANLVSSYLLSNCGNNLCYPSSSSDLQFSLSQGSYVTGMQPSPVMLDHQLPHLSQESSVAGQQGTPLVIPRRDDITGSSFHIQRHDGASTAGIYHFGQGTIPPYVRNPHQPHGNTNIDLNDLNKDSSL